MVNEEVDIREEIALGMAGTSKAQETRPSLSSSPSHKPAPLNLLPRLLLLIPFSLGILHLPPSHSHLCRPHHSTQASIKLYLWRGGLV